MNIEIGYECTFIFPALTTSAETKGLYFVGLAATFVFAMLNQLILNLKRRFYKQEGRASLDLLLTFLIFTCAIIDMYLLMTVNAGVIAVLIAAQIAGYFATLRIATADLSYNSSFDSYLLKD